MTSRTHSPLSADKPLSDPQNDRLGYAPFARHLAESICEMDPTEGFVIALYGSWGSGKTTAVNFIVYYLDQIEGSDQPVIVYFNPWWFTGHEELTRRFFDQLQASLGKRRDVSHEVAKKISDLARVVSAAPLPYSFLAKLVEMIAGWWFTRPTDVPEAKGKVADALRNAQKRILVVVDDIDRLTAEEIRQLFRVIKAVADLPNIVYLLAFDKNVAIKALSETQGTPGDEYLEKIVQVPFELPLPDKTSLRGLLDEKLGLILADVPEESFDQNYWFNVYFDGIDHFIATPRDIVRLINTLSVTYASVHGEVNPVDFIAIEALRVFSPIEYNIVRKNPESFTGRIDEFSTLGQTSKEDLRTFHDSWLQQVREENRDPIQRLMIHLFPKLGGVWGNINYGGEYESIWSSRLRVCSPNRFPVYFRLAVPEGEISNGEMMAMLALASDSKAFGTKLLELSNQKRPDGNTRIRAFLERVQDYTREYIPDARIPEIIQALFDVGDHLLPREDEPRGFLEYGNDLHVGRVVYQLLRRLDEPKRFQVLKDAISNGEALATIVREVAVLEPPEDTTRPRMPNDVDLSNEHLQELKELALGKIQRAVQQNSLLQVPELSAIMYNWRSWAGDEEPKHWAEDNINDDKGLVMLLESFVQRIRTSGGSDVVARISYRFDPQVIEPFLEPEQIIDRVRVLVDASWSTEMQKTAMTQFITGYEMRQRGEDPNFPFR